MKDIFKLMKEKVGCNYISDLPDHKREVWEHLKELPLDEYSTERLEDFSRYVFGVRYSILTAVMEKGRDTVERNESLY